MALTDVASLPYLWLYIEGIGPRTETAGSTKPYRFSTYDPGFAPTGRWLPYLRTLPGHVEETLDPVTGETTVGAMAFDLVEGSGPSSVSAAQFLTDMLATREDAKVGQLYVNATAAVATLDVTRVVGTAAAVNAVLWIGREAAKITAVAADTPVAGTDRYTVTRAWYGTTAHAHYTSDDRGDSEVRYRPHYLRGREVVLAMPFREDAIATAEAAAAIVWRGFLDHLEFVTGGADHGAAWRIHCVGLGGVLDTKLGVHAFVGKTTGRDGYGARSPAGSPDITWRLFVEPGDDASGGLPDALGAYIPAVNSSDMGHLKIGDSLVEFDFSQNEDNAARLTLIVTEEILSLGGADALGAGSRSPGRQHLDVWGNRDGAVADGHAGEGLSVPIVLPVREVLPTDRTFANSQFKPIPQGGAGTASDHPIDIFLCLCMSTGAGTNTSGAVGTTNYDVLGSNGKNPYGAGIPYARFDLVAWEDMRGRTGEARMPGHVIGWDGEFNLREFAEKELLGPLGIAATVDESGLIAPVRIAEVVPGDTTTALTESDVVPRSEVWSWDMEDQVSQVTWKLGGQVASLVRGHAGAAGEPFEVRSLNAAGRVRYERMRNRTLKFEIRGILAIDGGAPGFVNARNLFLNRHFQEPPPRLEMDLNWSRFRLALGSAVTLTHSSLPNPKTGARGLTAEEFIVIERRMSFDGVGDGGGGGIHVTLFWVGLDDIVAGLWAPSAVVAAGDAGTGAVVTVTENVHSDGVASGSVVADDTDGFAAGGVGTGDIVVLQNADGVVRCDNSQRVTAKTATTITVTLTAGLAFTLAGVEVARAAGDVVVLASDTGGPAPATAWTSHMQESAAFADNTAKTVGSTARLYQFAD